MIKQLNNAPTGFASKLCQLIILGAISCGSVAQVSGLDQVRVVGPFLNGKLPTRRPLDPASSSWTVSPTFSNLDLDMTLVIEPNPSNNLLYVASRDGLIKSFENDPATSTANIFLDLRDRVGVVWDGGFLGLTFHPDYGQPGSLQENFVYVYYSARCGIVGPHPTRPGAYEIEGEFSDGNQLPLHACKPQADIPDNFGDSQSQYFFDTYLRLSRFSVDLATNIADPDSEVILLNIRLFNGSHRGGGLEFGNDGYLWLTIGEQFRYETAQDIVTNLEGGILRMATDVVDHGDGSWSCPAGSHQPLRLMDDVSTANDFANGVYEEISGKFYCIPDTNPWLDAGGGVFEEYATIGHRNPHRMSRDSLTGRLWSAEIGASSREEVNVIALGQNNGWPFREGLISGVRSQPASYIGVLTDPVIDFLRADANAIIGGHVYRGSRFPELYGKYLAGDYGSSKIWAISLDEASMTATANQLTTFSPGGLGTWGQDNQGEVFLGGVHTQNLSLFTLQRVGEPTADAPALLSALGVFDDLPSLDVADFMVPYDLIQPFWSDNAYKLRWVAIPNDGVRDSAGEKVIFSADSNWAYPVGTVFMKHFELPLNENDPAVRARLETRFIIHGDDGRWYGLTYRWRNDLSDADLLLTDESATYTIQLANGGTRQQSWLYPSRDQCLSCHTLAAGGSLGARTHQLNNSITYQETGLAANQLLTWSHLGMFDTSLAQTDVDGFLRSAKLADASASLELRARSWLDSNCSYCHRPETGRAVFDARLTTSLDTQQLIYGYVADNYGLPNAHIISPGEPANSVALIKIASVGADAMPPLAKSLAEQPAVDLLREWVQRIKTDQQVVYGLDYQYYETGSLSVLPDFSSLSPTLVGSSQGFDITTRLRNDNFAYRFSGKIYIAVAGAYTFYTNSDDGSQLLINTGLVVDNDGLHGNTEQSGIINLPVGYHDIVVTMFERGGNEVLGVNWQGPGFAKQPIAAGVLYREIPVPASNETPILLSPGSLNLREGDSPLIVVSATDVDNDSLYYSANQLPEGLSLDSDSGVISGVLPVGSAGTYSVVLGVSDGPAVDSVQLSWTVSPPLKLTAPVDQLSYVGDSPLLQVTATGGGALTYSVSGLPDGLSINSANGEITGLMSAIDIGSNPVQLTVDDGIYSDTASFNWLVLLSFPGDQDNDGMPDQYEVDNQLNPLVNDSAGDNDSDGISNVDEYQAGTDPNVFNASGDVNGDGTLNVGDLFLLQQYLLGFSVLDAQSLARADIYPLAVGDGEINLSDVLLLQQWLQAP